MRTTLSSLLVGRPLTLALALALPLALTSCAESRGSDGADLAGVKLDPQFMGCATGVQDATVRPLYLQFVLDGSGSMSTDGKWDAVTAALGGLFDEFGASPDPMLGAGLIIYADSMDPTSDANGMPGYGPYPTSVDVPLRMVDATHLARLKERLSAMPKGTTPTLPALQGGFSSLGAFAGAAPLKGGGKKVLVLLTDGFPFSAIDSDTQVTQSIATTQMMQSLPSPQGPITTFSVGIGPFPSADLVEYDPTFCGRIAEAGGTKATPGCNPTENSDPSKVCYFQITPGAAVSQLTAAFRTALEKIRTQATDCDFLIQTDDGGTLDPSTTNVQYTPPGGAQKVIGASTTNGWSFDDPDAPTRVRLNGAACEEYRSKKGQIDIVIGCQAVVL